jgi:hypothetical protein
MSKTAKDYESLANVIGDAILRLVRGPKISGRFDSVEARLAALEARPSLKWGGIYVDGQEYQEAQLVTRSGSLWVSTKATTTTPGSPESDWRLVVKKGDAR